MSDPESAEPLLTKRELAARHKVSIRAVEHWLKAGLPARTARRGARMVRVFAISTADRWIHKHRLAGQPAGPVEALCAKVGELAAAVSALAASIALGPPGSASSAPAAEPAPVP